MLAVLSSLVLFVCLSGGELTRPCPAPEQYYDLVVKGCGMCHELCDPQILDIDLRPCVVNCAGERACRWINGARACVKVRSCVSPPEERQSLRSEWFLTLYMGAPSIRMGNSRIGIFCQLSNYPMDRARKSGLPTMVIHTVR